MDMGMSMADHGLSKIPTQKSSVRASATWLQTLWPPHTKPALIPCR